MWVLLTPYKSIFRIREGHASHSFLISVAAEMTWSKNKFNKLHVMTAIKWSSMWSTIAELLQGKVPVLGSIFVCLTGTCFVSVGLWDIEHVECQVDTASRWNDYFLAVVWIWSRLWGVLWLGKRTRKAWRSERIGALRTSGITIINCGYIAGASSDVSECYNQKRNRMKERG